MNQKQLKTGESKNASVFFFVTFKTNEVQQVLLKEYKEKLRKTECPTSYVEE